MKAMCEFFGVSRAAYYEWLKKLVQDDPNQERMEQIQAAYEASHKTYGYRRITLHVQQKQGLLINHKAVLRLMNKLNIRSVARRRKMYKKLEEIGTYHSYPNLLNRDFVAIRPNQKWVTDTPALACRCKCYLHRHPARLVLSVHHQRSIRWFYRCPCLCAEQFHRFGNCYRETRSTKRKGH